MDYTDILIPLRKIVRTIHLDSKQIQKTCGMSIPQLLTLTFLNSCEDYKSSQLSIRNYLHLNSSTITGIIGRLIEKGYIARTKTVGDKRSTWVCLTAKGLKQLNESPQTFQEKLANNLASLREDEMATIQKGLSLLLQVLEAKNEDPTPIIV